MQPSYIGGSEWFLNEKGTARPIRALTFIGGYSGQQNQFMEAAWIGHWQEGTAQKQPLPRVSSTGSRREIDERQVGTLIARREVCEDFTQFSVQTFMVFIPVSASVLVLNTPSPITVVVVVVVVGFLSTIVHFFVVVSLTT
jgi:hypothetical protein